MTIGYSLRQGLPRGLVYAGIVAIVAAGLAQVHRAFAQTYPTRVIKMIVPFAPGGQPDAMARLIGAHLNASIGTVIIDNRPGANGLLAVRAATGAEPDGHTLLYGSVTTLAILPAISRSADFDPMKAFVPVAPMSTSPFIMVVGPSVKARTVQEFVAFAKANPGKLNFAAPTGGPPHLGGEMFKHATGVDIVPVSYRTMNQAFTDLIGGQMDIIFDAPALLLPLIRDGRVRALVAMSKERTPLLPEVPTMAESGLGDTTMTVWNGLVAPAGTPAPIVQRLNTAVNEGLRTPGITTTLANFGSEPFLGSPQDFSAFVASEAKKWADVIRLAGVKID